MSELHVFETEGELAPAGVEFNNKTADELRTNCAIKIYDRDTRRCQMSGVVTEAYRYGEMTILAVWDADEPLAWAMVLNSDGTVTHYDRTYDVLAIAGWAETFDDVGLDGINETECALTGARYSLSREGLEGLRGQHVVEPEKQIILLMHKTQTSRNLPSIEDCELRSLIDEAAAHGEFDRSPYVDPWRAFCAHRKQMMAAGVLVEINPEKEEGN